MAPAGHTCPVPGCPTILTTGRTRCAEHQAEHERRRGTRQARGYDTTHDHTRAALTPLLATGALRCVTCGTILNATFDLGHNDNRTAYIGPQCIPCNRGAGGARATHDPATR